MAWGIFSNFNVEEELKQSLQWNVPDAEALKNFLIIEKGFKEKSLTTGLEKLGKSKGKANAVGNDKGNEKGPDTRSMCVVI